MTNQIWVEGQLLDNESRAFITSIRQLKDAIDRIINSGTDITAELLTNDAGLNNAKASLKQAFIKAITSNPDNASGCYGVAESILLGYYPAYLSLDTVRLFGLDYSDDQLKNAIKDASPELYTQIYDL